MTSSVNKPSQIGQLPATEPSKPIHVNTPVAPFLFIRLARWQGRRPGWPNVSPHRQVWDREVDTERHRRGTHAKTYFGSYGIRAFFSIATNSRSKLLFL